VNKVNWDVNTIEPTETGIIAAGLMPPAAPVSRHVSWDNFTARQNPEAIEKWRAEEWAEIDSVKPVAGTIEATLAEKFAATGCPEIISTDLECSASFTHYTSEGLKPNVNIGPTNLSDRELLMGSRDHERVHVLQYFFNAAAHAIPLNRGTPVVLDPRSAILMMKLMEREAYTVQWLLSERRAGRGGAGGKVSDAFLRRATLMAARTLENLCCVSSNKPFTDHYGELALAQYETQILKRQEAGEKITYAYLEPKQIRAIGNSLGLDLFGPEDEDAEIWTKEALPLDLLNQVFDLEKKLGIELSEVLPFGKALKQAGYTEETFLKANMARAQKGQKIISPSSMTLHQA
jgi:hypothetical protein